MILRRVTALESDASVSAVLDLAPDYGRGASAAWHREGTDWLASSAGLHARWSGAHNAATVEAQGGPGLALNLRLRRGQPVDLVLEIGCSGFSDRAPVDADDLWRRTASSWAAAVPDCHDVAAARDVRRSFAVLRGLTDPQRRDRRRRHDGAAGAGGCRPQLRLPLRLDPRHVLHRPRRGRHCGR